MKSYNRKDLRKIRISRPKGYNWAFIQGDCPDKLRNAIDSITSYYGKGYEWSSEYQSGNWDGRTRLLKQTKTGAWMFPAGLMDRVLVVMRALKYKPVINDQNLSEMEPPNPNEEKSGIVLWDFQRTAIGALYQCYSHSGVISTRTGTGKTFMALWWAAHIGKPFMVVVHRAELMYQWAEAIKKYLGVTVALVGDDNETQPGHATVCMIQTLAARMKSGKIKSIATSLVIFDECHIIPANNFFMVASAIHSQYKLGLSATPIREDGAELKIQAMIGVVCYCPDIESVVGKYIAEPRFQILTPPACMVRPYAPWEEAYEDGIVRNGGRNSMIQEAAESCCHEGRQVYIHVSRLEHGRILNGMISNSVFLSGETPQKIRRKIMEDFSAGKIRCLISTLLKEGVSINGISCVIYAAGMQSETAVIQTIGRSLRIDKRFGDAIIIDFADHGNQILHSHADARFAAYRRVYGDLFKY